MKKIISALLLASMLVAALASCGSGEDNTTTTPAGTTTTAATTTTKAGPPQTEPTEAEPEPTLPVVPGAGLEDLLAGLTKAEVDLTQLGVVDFDAWDDNENKENLDGLFDGIKTQVDFEAAGRGKCGGHAAWGDENGAWFYFALTEAATIKAYVITTGNDNTDYPGRNPVEWTLYGTNDEAAFAAGAAAGLNNNPGEGEDTRKLLSDVPFDESKWTKLDYVYDGKIEDGNFLENGYEIDADAQQSFKYYVWVLGYTGDGNFQACEFELYK